MANPYTELLRFALIALMVLVVVGGGTTLAHFGDKRRPLPPKPVPPVNRLPGPSEDRFEDGRPESRPDKAA
jgi:hypothetical protein